MNDVPGSRESQSKHAQCLAGFLTSYFDLPWAILTKMHTHIGVFRLSPRHVSGPGFLVVHSLPSVPSRSEGQFLSLFLGTWFPQMLLFSASLSPKAVARPGPSLCGISSPHTRHRAPAYTPGLRPSLLIPVLWKTQRDVPPGCRFYFCASCWFPPLACKRPWGRSFVAVTSLSPAPLLSGGFKLAAGWPCPLCPVPVAERACCMRCLYS